MKFQSNFVEEKAVLVSGHVVEEGAVALQEAVPPALLFAGDTADGELPVYFALIGRL